ncbi:MAG: hydroxymethylpyrimidine/phosphomethylpyrimidine kinase, partial [Sphingomonas sp.]|nr:hydroxymethylpyrimidine/phosphomethylpyrimidine kinase [Sphingomonas sp.]
MTLPRILSIAGSDSGGGAGIQADIKTITMLGGHAMTAITAITAQNTLGVSQIMPVPADVVLAQIDAVISDIGVDAVKIGMIGSAEIAGAIANFFSPSPLPPPSGGRALPVVFDPVMIATSGAILADAGTVAAFERLMAIATLITPNAPELAALTGLAVESESQLELAARALAERHGIAVLAKSGHLPGKALTDVLIDRNGAVTRWTSERIETRHSH